MNPASWAHMLIERDNRQGPKVLYRMLAYYDEHDGRADDFGRLFIVVDAERALADNNLPPQEPTQE